MPSLAALRAFDALARTGGFSSAARELNVTHAAVAQHVRALESRFGLPLALRDGQVMRLTEAGHVLAESLRDGFDQIADGVARVTQTRDAGPVRVSLTPSFAEAWLMPRLGGFWEQHPEIEIALSPSTGLADLRRDGFDLAIRFGDGSWPGLTAQPLSVCHFVVVARPDYGGARKLADLEDPARHRWFFAHASSEQQVWGLAAGVDFNSVPTREMETNGLALSAVRAGLGLSIQASQLVEADLASGQLVSLYEGDPGGLGYYIVTRSGIDPTPNARAFIAWLKKSAQPAP